jgi:hypothetical protein
MSAIRPSVRCVAPHADSELLAHTVSVCPRVLGLACLPNGASDLP